MLAQKLVVLLLLLSGQRWQSIHLLDIPNISYVHGGIKITIGDLLKTSKPGMHMFEINLPMFKQDVRIWVVTVLQCFSQRTSGIRHDVTRLFISTIKPHVGVGRDTISRWTKYMLCRAGINMSIFSAHSQAPLG